METVIVAVIVGLAAAYAIKKFYAGTKKGGACGCGCSSCPASEGCGEKDSSL